MKKFNYISLAFLSLIFLGACEQEVMTLTQPEPNTTNINPDPCAGGAGTANFTKFVALGNSFVAGVQGGALFTDGQDNSLAAIVNKQLACAGGTATFNQPSIRASLGWNLFITQPFLSNPANPVLGRLRLQGTPPRPTPQAYAPGNLEAVPNPSPGVNPPFQYAGSAGAVATNQLNNFSVPAITVGQTLTATAGDWANPNPALGFTPFYARFASVPGTSTILSDAASAQGTFGLVWLGLDDFFLYAAFGGDPTLAPLTSNGDFATRLGAVFAHPIIGLFTTSPDMKAVIGNFPDIFKMPHFTSVPWNAIAFTAADQAKIDGANAGYAPYNAGLDAAFGGGLITADERDRRKVNFAIGANGIVLEDESLTDLSGLGLPSIRQATSADIFPLATGSILGTEATPGNPATTWGVGKALTDRYAIIPAEKDAINAARAAFNATVTGVVAANTTKLALADVDAALNALITAQAGIYNGVTITPNINPPTGIYSEDGVHPNTRGYAFLANVFIDAINAKFGSTIPRANLAKYSATGLPLP